ncbi:hypothetical protein M0802_013508 [Mischocyttarus mexicanus]|nr:hypothetical protein M0802_013509 [Mischocyttarus mexicanus]KAI4483016.1 hypothetical protein M0802_013508 [Mischocyttarus mexicanus]
MILLVLFLILILLLLLLLVTATVAIASTVQIECASESIIVHISTEGKTDFHGLVYPRGLSKNSSCLQEYRSQPSPITYNLPLRSCNTMPTELKEEDEDEDEDEEEEDEQKEIVEKDE